MLYSADVIKPCIIVRFMQKNIFIVIFIALCSFILSGCANLLSQSMVSQKATGTPKHIALLLPLEGPMGVNGRSVRDGFLSAYYESSARAHIQQTISFYDTSKNPNIAALYQEAIQKGADRVVGPLIKKDVQALVHSGNITVPTLALNYTDIGWAGLPHNFYEFGLSPLDEAQQLADKAKQDGRSRALVIASEGEWGRVVSKTLINQWQLDGGYVIDALYFTPQTDLTTAIPGFLHVNIANDRKTTNKLALEQQRRQDFDVIFLLAEPQNARQIVPLLKYYYVENIPIYATSAIYSGVPNPQKDKDLNGVIFCDIPWLLTMAHANNNRLYAVGRDAYRISNELSHFPFSGATGELTLSSKQQVYRRLSWTVMRDGHP